MTKEDVLEARIGAMTTAMAIIMATISEASSGGKEMMLDGLRFQIARLQKREVPAPHVEDLRRLEAYLSA